MRPHIGSLHYVTLLGSEQPMGSIGRPQQRRKYGPSGGTMPVFEAFMVVTATTNVGF